MIEEPTDSRERWQVVTETLLPAVTAGRALLALDEETFLLHTFRTAPRQFFLRSALDEVSKTAVYLMKLDGFMDADSVWDPSKQPDPTERSIQAVLLEETRLRARRLCELLIQLVLFSQKDQENLYEHFLLLEEIVGATGYNADIKKYHGEPSDWVQATLDAAVAEARKVERSILEQEAWYAGNYKRPVDANKWRNLLSGVGPRLERAFPVMTDFEKMALGATYFEAFSVPSRSVHFQPASLGYEMPSIVVAEGTRLGLVAMAALRRIHILLGRPISPPLDQVTRVLESSHEGQLFLDRVNVRGDIDIGDFVVARGYLGQVADVRTSGYGYRSVQVDFLAETPLPNLATSWFRVRDVQWHSSRKKLVLGIKAKVGESAMVDDGMLRQSVLDAWNFGLRDQIRGRCNHSG